MRRHGSHVPVARQQRGLVDLSDHASLRLRSRRTFNRPLSPQGGQRDSAAGGFAHPFTAEHLHSEHAIGEAPERPVIPYDVLLTFSPDLQA